jgi:hypothetical protein
MAHVGEAAQRVVDIQAAALSNKAARKTVGNVAKAGLGVARLAGAGATAAKILGSKHER